MFFLQKKMETITLTYDAHETRALEALESILSLGIFNALPQVATAEKSLYNPEFVNKIKSRENMPFYNIDLANLWIDEPRKIGLLDGIAKFYEVGDGKITTEEFLGL